MATPDICSVPHHSDHNIIQKPHKVRDAVLNHDPAPRSQVSSDKSPASNIFFSSVYAGESASAVPPYNSLLIVSKVYHTFPSLTMRELSKSLGLFLPLPEPCLQLQTFFPEIPRCVPGSPLPADLPLGGTEAT